jgi:hypothetical protein
MKINRFAAAIALGLLTAACAKDEAEDTPAVEETTPPPAPAPAPDTTAAMDTTHMMDSTATSTTTGL